MKISTGAFKKFNDLMKYTHIFAALRVFTGDQ